MPIWGTPYELEPTQWPFLGDSMFTSLLRQRDSSSLQKGKHNKRFTLGLLYPMMRDERLCQRRLVMEPEACYPTILKFQRYLRVFFWHLSNPWFSKAKLEKFQDRSTI